MSLIPPEFDPNSESNGFKVDDETSDNQSLAEETPIVLSPLEQQRVQETQQRLQRMFLILVGVGALVGLVVAIALILVLNRFGLTDAPDEPEQYQQLHQETVMPHALLPRKFD